MRKFYFLGEIFVKSSQVFEKSNDFSGFGKFFSEYLIAWREGDIQFEIEKMPRGLVQTYGLHGI